MSSGLGRSSTIKSCHSSSPASPTPALSDWSLCPSRPSHGRYLVIADAERLGDLLAARGAQRAAARPLDAGAQAAEIEEQRLLSRRGAGPYDRPIAQDEILHCRADPPTSVGREAHTALGIEAPGGQHEPDIALLDEIAHGQAVVAVLARSADGKPRVGADQLVERHLVLFVAPTGCQLHLTLTRQHRGADGLLDEASVGALSFGGLDVVHGVASWCDPRTVAAVNIGMILRTLHAGININRTK